MLAATAGSLLSRQWFGPEAAFSVPDYAIVSNWEFPAFALLGVVCAAVALLFQLALLLADGLARQVTMPLWLRPVLGGLIVGLLGLAFHPDYENNGYFFVNYTC